MTSNINVDQYVKQTITVNDLLPIFIELDRASQLKAVQIYPSVIAILKSIVKPEYINNIEEFDIDLTTAIIEQFKQKVPLQKILKILNNEIIDANPDVVVKYAKEKIKIKDLRAVFEQLDKQMQTNTASLYVTVTAMLKAVLKDGLNPEELEINDAVELFAYAMTKIDFNRIQQLFSFLT
jgi:hypothetical protein